LVRLIAQRFIMLRTLTHCPGEHNALAVNWEAPVGELESSVTGQSFPSNLPVHSLSVGLLLVSVPSIVTFTLSPMACGIVLAARDARHLVLDHQALHLTLTHLERHSDLIHRHKSVFLFNHDSPGFHHNERPTTKHFRVSFRAEAFGGLSERPRGLPLQLPRRPTLHRMTTIQN
jgi:hypothetical protein